MTESENQHIIPVRVTPELFKLIKRTMRKKRIKHLSAAGRAALAEWVGKPELAEGRPTGRPKQND